MTSDSTRKLNVFRALPGRSAFAPLAAFATLAALSVIPARAEDPLLGRIKLIQCVGCTPGSVDLVIHDPIDVRDFQVRINEADYQKIITPLAGKTVYDKAGCFYWMDAPKGGAKPAAVPAAPTQVEPPKEAKEIKGAKGKKGHKGPDTVAASPEQVPSEGLVETSAPPPTPEIQGTPSKCIPYARVEVKPAKKTGKEEE